MRPLLRKLRWTCAWPVLAYLRYSPVRKGKGFLVRNFIRPAVPAPDLSFTSTLPGGARVDLCYAEALGEGTLIGGVFERAELEFARRTVRFGTTVVDVGANIGVFTLVLARAVPDVRVLALEPVPDNRARLARNLAENRADNVEVLPVAAGAVPGTVDLRVPLDGAYASWEAPVKGSGVRDRVVSAQVLTLDIIWGDRGCPDVSFVKVDVEGAELEVLRGALTLLGACQPSLLVEANTPMHLARLTDFLAPLGYRCEHPAGFEQWNYAFRPDQARVG